MYCSFCAAATEQLQLVNAIRRFCSQSIARHVTALIKLLADLLK